ncbi:putative RNA-directed DNA polymerase, eukaryota, reverse transcriptase zinc-binding domain protein [Tanacetum coccineum]|uniref:RNA-directed DNA polymerase, eukaryota, reverse transcriptase zinc-binding domain protein n=1 Tax=Tanacetum coccineum TaxID=301880 RepID=A0ABQ5J5U8_9ASTR
MAIKGVLKDGSWIEDSVLVKAEFLHYFQKCFAPYEGPRPWLGVDLPKHLSSLHSENFPDGFTFAFFKHFWSIIEEVVIRFVVDFSVIAHISKGCNPSFIALILKVSDPKVVSDFRPISLIGCQYKIIDKLLANRLSLVIGECVSSEQSAFIKGRSILDGLLILNEVMEWYWKRKRRLMIFKVDFEKAYDSLRWEFLDLLMAEMGFDFK